MGIVERLKRLAPGATTLSPLVAGVAAGLCMPLALPPFGLFPLIFLGLGGAIAVLAGRPASAWLLCGGAFGAAWFGTCAPALVSWDWKLSAVSLLACSATAAAAFGMGGLAGGSRPRGGWSPWVALAGGVTVVAWSLDELGALYPPLAAALTEPLPLLARSVQILGVPALDGVLVLGAGCLARLVALSHGRARSATGAAATGALLALLGHVAGQPDGDHKVPVVMLQPTIETETYRAVSWSLAARASIEERVDRLVVEAVRSRENDPGLILLPETASGLPDLQLPRRVAKLERILTRAPGTQLLAGTFVTDEVGLRNAAAVFEKENVRQGVPLAFKQNAVPFAEADLITDRASIVVDTTWGRIGITICFDALLGKLVRRAARADAEIIIAPSDSASLGHSSLAHAHVAFVRLRALEVGRGVVVASNFGPSVAVEPSGKLAGVLPRGERGLMTASVSRASTRTPASLGTRHILPVGLLLFGVGWELRRWRSRGLPRAAPGGTRPRASWARGRIGRDTGRVGARGAAGAVLGLLLSFSSGAIVELFAIGTRLGGSHALAADLWRRSAGLGERDGIGRAFRQSRASRCGAAALAHALTQLGDLVTETELAEGCVPPFGELSFSDLARCAKRRGFVAEGYDLPWDALSSARIGMKILHYREGHFVTLLAADAKQATVLDPSEGRVLTLSAHEMQNLWSGRVLRIGYRPLQLGGVSPRHGSR